MKFFKISKSLNSPFPTLSFGLPKINFQMGRVILSADKFQEFQAILGSNKKYYRWQILSVIIWKGEHCIVNHKSLFLSFLSPYFITWSGVSLSSSSIVGNGRTSCWQNIQGPLNKLFFNISFLASSCRSSTSSLDRGGCWDSFMYCRMAGGPMLGKRNSWSSS